MPEPHSLVSRLLRSSLALACIGNLSAADYYIDPAGNDSNAGTSPAAPWQTLGKVNATVFQPGDNVLFKRGGTWVGTLSPQGSGNSSARITLGAYGEGAKPRINGNGAWAVITLSSQSYWTIDGFEVTNPAGDTSNGRSGIRVDWSGSGTMQGIEILNNDVRDIYGIKNVNDGGRNNGGIFFWINEPGKADGVLIEGNTVKNIYGQGIAFNAEAEYMGGGMNYANCSPNVVARGNTVLTTSGDGILMLGTDNELVEYNEVGYVGQLSDLYNNIAAAWPTRHVGGLWQYNHVHHTAALSANDSTAFDNDGFVKGTTVFQYNYTHDNAGGFLMEYTWGGDEGAQTIARYNISWNESRVLATNRNSARFYNNVFYNPGATLDVTWTQSPSYVLFSNNLFVGAGRSAEFSRQLFMNNNFSGGMGRPTAIDGNVTTDPQFVSPNTTGNLAGFILQTTSPARNSGFVIAGNGGKDFWGVSLPATAPHRGASQIGSISNYTATPSFLRITGADSVEIPETGTNTSAFVPILRDQNFHPISSPAVTWSVSPAVAGVSIDSNGTLSVSSTAIPRRIAVQATSGSLVASYSVALFANHPLTYTWGGANSSWTDTSATGWDGGPPVNGDSVVIPAGTVAATTNNQQGGIGVTVVGSGHLRSGGFYLTPGNLTLADGATVSLENTAHYANYGGGWLPSTVTVSGSAAAGSFLTGEATHAFWNLTNGTVFDVADVTGDTNPDLTVSAGLKDAVGSPDTTWNASGIVKTGAGTMKLTSVNTYTGGTTVNQGSLLLDGGTNGYAPIKGALTVNNGASVNFANDDGTGLGWQNDYKVTSLTINGGSVISGGIMHVWDFAGGVTMTGGTLASNGGVSDPGGGFLEWHGTSVTTQASAASATIGGRIRIRSDGGYSGIDFTVADGAAATDLLVSAAITEANGAVGITKNGSGTMLLSGNNSYAGVTSIHAGMLVAASSSALGAGGHNGATMTFIYNGATLALQGGVSINEHFHFWGNGVGGLGALRNLSGNNALTDSYCLRSNVTVGVDADTLTVPEFYEDGGSFGLTKTGPGTLVLTGSSTYSGDTTVNAGTLVADTAGTLGTGDLTVADGATCDLRNTSTTGALADNASIHLNGTGKLIIASGVTETVAELYVDGVRQTVGTYTTGSHPSLVTGAGSLNVLGPAVALTAPVSRQIVQRNGANTGSIVITGSYMDTPDSIEARAVVMAGVGNNGTATPWTTIVATPSGGTFSGTLSGVAAGGWYQIEVRSVTGGDPSANITTVERVGVGEVYVTAGQSNSCNWGEPGTNTDDRVSAMNFSNGAWSMAADPMPGGDGPRGSVWTRLGPLLTANDNVPVGFISVGVGGTAVSYWVPPATDGYLRLKAAAQAFPPNGFRAVLWHQGESDSSISTTPADYQARLSSAIAQLRTDAGWTVPWYIAEASDLGNTTLTQEEPVIAGQRRVIYADAQVFAGPSTDDFHLEGKLYDGVHFNNAGLADHAQQWADILAGTAPLAPKNGDIESNAALADGGIAAVNMADVSSNSVISWRILNASGEAVADGGNGYFNPDALFYGAAATDTGSSGGVLPNMSGRHVAFFYSGSAGNHFLQTRRANLQANTTYALTVALGVRGNGGIYGNARIELLANGVSLASRDVTQAELDSLNGGNATNTFTDVQLTYTSGPSVTAGQPLSIRITKLNGGDTTYDDFDNVRLATVTSDYDTWKNAFNGSGGPDDDDDYDGLTNRFEYAFGQNPAVPSGSPVVFLSATTGTNLTYTRRKQSLTGMSYSVWISANLTDWTEDASAVQNATDIPDSDNESVEVALTAQTLNGERLFVRIQAN